MRKKIAWEWQQLDECTQRVAVIGGWLVLRLAASCIEKGKNGTSKTIFKECMEFVPDRDHEWHVIPSLKEIEKEKSAVNVLGFEP